LTVPPEPQPAAEPEPDQPFVGPRPFKKGEEAYFFGRERESEDLLSMVIANRAVVLYARSGAGKTSLLNAKLIPALEREGVQVLPVARVRSFPAPGVEPPVVENLYSFNVLSTWSQSTSHLDRPTLERFAQLSLADYLDEHPHVDEDGLEAPRALVFDQFEELFVLYPDRRSDREDFFVQVQQVLERNRLLRVLFVMREDYIAHLDPYVDILPDKLRSRYRLEGLNRDAALSAVMGPVLRKGRHFAGRTAARIVEDLLTVRARTSTGEVKRILGEFVEPVQLQVVCHSWWLKVPEFGAAEISEEDLKIFGDTADQALARYYEDCIGKVAAEAGTAEESLRRWFEKHLITPEGGRGIVSRGTNDTGGVPNRDVDRFEEQHLVRTEWRGEDQWCELAHDRFIDPIRNANRQWRETLEAGPPDERARLREFVNEASGFLAEVDRLSREESPESYRQILDAALKWRSAFSSVPDAPQPMPVLSTPIKKKLHTDEDVAAWLQDQAHLQSTLRKMNAMLKAPAAEPQVSFTSPFDGIRSSYAEITEDWLGAALIFALKVLEGEIHLTRRLQPASYWRLEDIWLSEVKRTKAFLNWERNLIQKLPESRQWSPDDYYFEACRRLRKRLADEEHKARAADFALVREYIRDRYLDNDGNFSPGTDKSEKLLRAKAQQIFEVTGGQGAGADWHHACTYSRMFYENIITAVEAKDEESTLVVLKAFQYSKAPEHRYLIINCFEAAVALYFLDAEIIRGLWEAAKHVERPEHYTSSTVLAPGWPDFWTPPGELLGRLTFDSTNSRLVLHGVLREREKKALLDQLPHPRSAMLKEAVLELMKSSRLLPEETTI
jgi:hypothetical protein